MLLRGVDKIGRNRSFAEFLNENIHTRARSDAFSE
jgi:hypothetical protein